MGAQPRWPWLAAAILAIAPAGPNASACHTCGQTPCTLAPPPAPAFECVTEMVPWTIMKSRTRVDLVPAYTKTVTETKIDIVYDEQVQPVCRLVFDTVFQTRCVTVCWPVCETTMVCQPYTVCRPVTRTRRVTEYRLRPYSECVAVPVKGQCGHSGPAAGWGTCQTRARTCYRRVPVVREVTETCMVTEVRTQMVPVVHWRMVPERRIEPCPVTVVRMVNDTVRVRVPRMVFRCVPRTLVYRKAVLTCEEIPVTVYRPVVRMVPVVAPGPQAVPTPQGPPTATGQLGAGALENVPGRPPISVQGQSPEPGLASRSGADLR
jgi:hypothetical protein